MRINSLVGFYPVKYRLEMHINPISPSQFSLWHYSQLTDITNRMGWKASQATFTIFLASVLATLPMRASSTAWANEDALNWVLPSTQIKISRPFEPPAQNWLAGHRGVDFRGQIGDLVFATGHGVVVYADQLAGKGVIVISHGLVRTTYEPLVALVEVGDQVTPGQVIGSLAPGESHCATSETVWCLHWGAIRNGKYLNPLLLVYPKVRLLPLTK